MSALAPTVESLADYELVARALKGADSGFEELVRRYQRPIVSYVYRMTGDYEAALDLTQEVFIKVYGSLARYRSEYKFSTWIYRIAHNAAIDHLRRCWPRTPELVSEDGHARPFASGSLTPEQESVRKERRTENEDGIRQLPAA